MGDEATGRIFALMRTLLWIFCFFVPCYLRQAEVSMNAHFIFALTLILVAFALCFWFRKENKKK
jgi:hypothetical protein